MKVIEQKQKKLFVPVSLMMENVTDLEEVCDMFTDYYIGEPSVLCKLKEILSHYK